MRALLDLSPATFRRRRRPLRGEDEKGGRLGIGLRAVAGVGELSQDPGERVDQGEDGEAAPLPGDFDPPKADLASLLVKPSLFSTFSTSWGGSPSVVPMALRITSAKPSRRS